MHGNAVIPYRNKWQIPYALLARFRREGLAIFAILCYNQSKKGGGLYERNRLNSAFVGSDTLLGFLQDKLVYGDN